MRRIFFHHRALMSAVVCVLLTEAGVLARDAERGVPTTGDEHRSDGASRPIVLTVRDAVDRALAGDEGIAAARDTLVDAEWQVARARELRDPELRPSHSEARNQVSARMYVPNPWTRSHRIDAAVCTEKAVSAELKRAAWLLETRVLRCFVEIGFLDRDLAAVEALVELRRQALELARERLGAGQVTAPDLAPISGRYLTILSERDRTARRRDAARRQLAALVMVPAHRLTIVAEAERRFPTDLSGLCLSELEQRALRNRADLLASSWRADAAFAACKASRSEKIPWLRHVQASLAEDTGEGDEWSVEMAVTVPIFSWSSRKSTVAAAQHRQLKTAAQQAKPRVSQEVRNAWRAVEEAFEGRRRCEACTNPLVAELSTIQAGLRQADGAFQAQLIDIRIQLLGVERTRLRLEQEEMQALIQLEEAVGTQLYGEGK